MSDAYLDEYLAAFVKASKHIKKDYAGYQHGSTTDLANTYADMLASQSVTSGMSDIRFMRILTRYLSTFGDANIRCFADAAKSHVKDFSHGISVRHYGDALYVERSVNPEFCVGERIVACDYRSIADLSKIHAYELHGNNAEDEIWDDILHCCDTFEVTDTSGTSRLVKPSKTMRHLAPCENGVMDLDSNMVLVTLGDLSSPEAVEELIHTHAHHLECASRIIIDVRDCQGASAEALLALLPYVVDNGMVLADYLETSCQVRASLVNRQILQATAKQAPESFFAELSEVMSDTPDGEFFTCDMGMDDALTTPVRRVGPSDTALLIDSKTQGIAETLALMAIDSKRCSVIGRATAGNKGTLLPVRVPLNDRFWMEYPIAKYAETTSRHCATGQGISPDVHVPWNPGHLVSDVDLLTAMRQ